MERQQERFGADISIMANSSEGVAENPYGVIIVNARMRAIL